VCHELARFFSPPPLTLLSSLLFSYHRHLRVLRKRFSDLPPNRASRIISDLLQLTLGGPAAHLLGDERSGSFFARPKPQRARMTAVKTSVLSGEAFVLRSRRMRWLCGSFCSVLFVRWNIWGFFFERAPILAGSDSPLTPLSIPHRRVGPVTAEEGPHPAQPDEVPSVRPIASDLCTFRVNPSHLELKGSDIAQSIWKL
jgi:hypothetical protein